MNSIFLQLVTQIQTLIPNLIEPSMYNIDSSSFSVVGRKSRFG